MTRASRVPRPGATLTVSLLGALLILVATPAQAPIDAMETDCATDTLDVTLTEPSSNPVVGGFVEINWSKSGSEAAAATSNLYYQVGDENTSIASDLINTSYTWNTSRVSDGGDYAFVIEAETLTCHAVASTSTVAIDNTVPAASASAPTAGSLWTGAVNVTWKTTDAHPATVEVQASSDAGATWSSIGSVEDDGQASIDTSMLGDGTEHRLRMTPIDAAGNEGPPVTTASFAVDDTAPTITVDSPAEEATVSGTVEVTWSTNEAHPDCVDVEMRVGGSWTTQAECTPDDGSTWLDTTGLADGTYDLRLRAVDQLGHVGTSAVTRVTIANAPSTGGGGSGGGGNGGGADDGSGPDDPASGDGDGPGNGIGVGAPVTVTRDDGVVRRVRVVPAEDVANVTVHVEDLRAFPGDVDALPDDVVAVHRFTVEARADGRAVDVSETAITLTVPAEAVDAGEDPALYHWNGTAWDRFEVTEVSRADGRVTYEATVDGLSPFALGVHASPIPGASLTTVGLVLVVATLVAAAAVAVVHLRD